METAAGSGTTVTVPLMIKLGESVPVSIPPVPVDAPALYPYKRNSNADPMSVRPLTVFEDVNTPVVVLVTGVNKSDANPSALDRHVKFVGPVLERSIEYTMSEIEKV